MDKQITISVDEYNKLIDEHTKRDELPKKIIVKDISSKWLNWLKRAGNLSIVVLKKLQVRYVLISMDIGDVICPITLRMVTLITHYDVINKMPTVILWNG